MKALFDTNIVIDLLANREEAFVEHDRYSAYAISRITWIEVLVGAGEAESSRRWQNFMRQFEIVELDPAVAQLTITLRQQHRLRLPDAIVWASARRAGALLVTRNAKDFPKGEPSVRFPYKV